jgi:hypothetical protein
MCKAIRANDTHGLGSQILLSPDLFRPTDPAFAGSVSPYRSCFRRICFALPILPSPDLFRPTDPASPSYLLQTHFLSEISAILSGKKRLAPLV